MSLGYKYSTRAAKNQVTAIT
ncbi:uncharacterized protein FFB14_02546 [Fusarium fujikuroi]|nr:uncharacterized protein FFB14_02546 [Fusarium fujikuroi]